MGFDCLRLALARRLASAKRKPEMEISVTAAHQGHLTRLSAVDVDAALVDRKIVGAMQVEVPAAGGQFNLEPAGGVGLDRLPFARRGVDEEQLGIGLRALVAANDLTFNA